MKEVREGFLCALIMFWLLITFRWKAVWCLTFGHQRMKRACTMPSADRQSTYGTFECRCCGHQETRRVYQRKKGA